MVLDKDNPEISRSEVFKDSKVVMVYFTYSGILFIFSMLSN